MCWKTMSKHIGHQTKIVLFANWASRFGFSTNICRSPNKFWVGVTHLITTQTADPNLVNQHSTGKTMIDNSASIG